VGEKSQQAPEAHVDMGYRGHHHSGPETIHVDKRRRGSTPKSLWRWMKRRAAAEPTIGHLKSEHRLDRNRLKGTTGDAINAILSAAAMNFQKLQGFFWHFCLRLLDQLLSALLPIPSSGLRP
jgi:IS5 family transposase